jgi:death on curing protein
VRAAREVAAELGEPSLAPPTLLEDCPDRRTLEQALASPRAAFAGQEQYPTLHAKAAVLLYTLSKSQACRDGNKRVALIVVRSLLHINGARLAAADDAIADAILRAASSDRRSRAEEIIALTTWLEAVAVTTNGEETL